MKLLSAREYWITVVIGLVGSASIYAVVAVTQLGAPTGLTGATERYAVAQERSAARNGQKLLYASGSSGFYGVRCKRLSLIIGRPAVNFGLHGGLGLRYLMDRVMAASDSGDVIVIGPEWETYRGPRFGEYACDYIMSRRVEYLKSLPMALAFQLVLAAGPERVFTGFWSRLSNGVSPLTPPGPVVGVNECGDRVITPEDVAQGSRFAKNLGGNLPPWQTPSQHLTHDVDAFVAMGRKKGVRIVAVFPPLCITRPVDKMRVAAVNDGMRKFWMDRGVAVLGTVEDAMYEPGDAFDTPYHLIEPAAQSHTTKLGLLLSNSGVLQE